MLRFGPALQGILLCTLTLEASAQKPPAQPEAQPGAQPKAQPKRLELGRLRQGTHVEADVLIYWNDKRKAAAALDLRLPPFATKVRVETEFDGDMGQQTRVWLKLDTRRPAAHKGSIVATRAGRKIVLPVECIVLPQDPTSPRVLVAETPFNSFLTTNPRDLDAWRRVVDTGKLTVHYLSESPRGQPVLSARLLRRVDVVLIHGESLVRMNAVDRALLQGFACGGGRLILVASMFFGNTVMQANRVLAPFGLTMPAKEAQGLKLHEFTAADIRRHPLTQGVASIKIRRPTPTRVSEPSNILVGVPDHDDLAVLAIAKTAAGGEVITMGVPLPWIWASQAPGNLRLLRQLLARKRPPR